MNKLITGILILATLLGGGVIVYWLQPKPDIVAKGRFINTCPSEIKECHGLGLKTLAEIEVENRGEKTANNVAINFHYNRGIYRISWDDSSLERATTTKKFENFISVGDISINRKVSLFVVGDGFYNDYDKTEVSFEGGVKMVDFPVDTRDQGYFFLNWAKRYIALCYTLLLFFCALSIFILSSWKLIVDYLSKIQTK